MSERPELRLLPGGLPERRYGPRPRGLVASALTGAGSWLIEPAEREPESIAGTPRAPRTVVAVFGLGRGCGVTVISRALAAELARRDADGAAAVHCEARAAGIPLATPAASHLARALEDVPGAETRSPTAPGTSRRSSSTPAPRPSAASLPRSPTA
jgi:hypothetical protein